MKRRYTWQTFDMDFKEIREFLYSNKIDYDAVYAPTRGGLTLGTKISHEFAIPLGIIDLQTRDLKGNIEFNKEKIFKIDPLNVAGNNSNRIQLKELNVILVDEIADSGKTLKIIEEQFKKLNVIRKINLTIITIYGKKEFLDEYGWNYIREMQKGDWIFFPWEKQTNYCFHCMNAEACNTYGKKFIHCNILNKSFLNTYWCENFEQIE